MKPHVDDTAPVSEETIVLLTSTTNSGNYGIATTTTSESLCQQRHHAFLHGDSFGSSFVFPYQEEEDEVPATGLLEGVVFRYGSKSSHGLSASLRSLDMTDKEQQQQQQQQERSILGIGFIVIGSICFSCMFLFVKLMEGIANSFTLIFFRSLLQIAVCLLIVVKNQEHPLGQPSARLWLLLRGGAGAAAVVAFYFCIQHLPLPDAVTLQFTVPPFAAAFALAILGEPIELIDVAGSIVCFAGVALIAHPTWLFGDTNEADADNDPSENSPTAILIGLLGAALAGLAYVSVRPIRDRASANVMVLYFAACSIPITMLGSFWCLGTWQVWGDKRLLSSVWNVSLLLLVGASAYLGQFFTNLGLQRETAATATLVMCTQIVWTYVFELTFLHETIIGWSIGGTALILSFMVVVGIRKMRQEIS